MVLRGFWGLWENLKRFSEYFERILRVVRVLREVHTFEPFRVQKSMEYLSRVVRIRNMRLWKNFKGCDRICEGCEGFESEDMMQFILSRDLGYRNQWNIFRELWELGNQPSYVLMQCVLMHWRVLVPRGWRAKAWHFRTWIDFGERLLFLSSICFNAKHHMNLFALVPRGAECCLTEFEWVGLGDSKFAAESVKRLATGERFVE